MRLNQNEVKYKFWLSAAPQVTKYSSTKNKTSQAISSLLLHFLKVSNAKKKN